VIRLQGSLEFLSANSQIRLIRKDGEATCAVNGWPHPFTPIGLSHLKLPKEIKHEKVNILYNDRPIGYIKDGSFKLTGYFTGLRAYVDYLKSSS